MQKLLAIGTVGKKITVSENDRSRKFEFWLNVNETRTDADGKAYTVTTPVHCTAFRALSDEAFGKQLVPGCGAIVRGLAEPLLVARDGKQFGALSIRYADVHVVGRDVQAGMSVSAVGYVGMADTNTVGDMQVCNFSMAENLLDKQTGETRALWMRCALWRRPDKTKVFAYITPGALVAVDGAPYVRLYTDKTGETRVSLECRVENLDLLGGRKTGDGADGAAASAEVGGVSDPEPVGSEPAAGASMAAEGTAPEPESWKRRKAPKMQPPVGIGWDSSTFDSGAAADALPY